MNPPRPARPPIATYRLQLTPEFGLDAAAAVVDYLAALGVSHLYLSPVFEARPGSTHGYDQTDPTRLRHELGGEPAFERLAGAAHGAGLGIVLDIVPNHMAAHHDNPWWRALLKHGPGSEFDRFFDVDWARAGGRVVLPVLGAPLDEAIAKGQLAVERTESGPIVRYFDRLFPLRDDGPSLSAPLPELLAAQHYELAFWRDGLARINYRRFFDIADLAGLRIEDPEVFRQTHAGIIDLAARGRIDAVRVDHIDGLRDPLEYLSRLRAALDEATKGSPRLPIFVENILARDEDMPDAWPVDGTTGYEFLAASAALMVDPPGLGTLRSHAEKTGAGVPDFHALGIACKREVAQSILEPELARLCRSLEACLHVAKIDCDAESLRRATIELSSRLGVYRTYADAPGMSASDADRLAEAAQAATSAATRESTIRAIALLEDLFTLSGPFEAPGVRERALASTRLWQQFTGPLAAKGIEDTALYRDIAVLALNDVGTEPVATDAAPQVARLAAQRRARPLSLNTTDTHDAKRSEDVRARLAALSHDPEPWTRLLDQALPLLAPDHAPSPPTATDRSLILHSALALWPLDTPPDPALADRLKAYIVKAAREAKRSTAWTAPNAAYEDACGAAVDALLFSDPLADVRRHIADLARATRALAGRLSVASILLKALLPGTPDWYQGAECRVLALVDPDNRRPVDFAHRRELLADIARRWRDDPAAAASSILNTPDSDAAKLFVSWRALAIRRRLLADGGALILDSFTHDRSHWRWTASAGARRLVATVRFDDSTSLPAPDAPPPHDGAIDQISAVGAHRPPAWAGVVLDGVRTLW